MNDFSPHLLLVILFYRTLAGLATTSLIPVTSRSQKFWGSIAQSVEITFSSTIEKITDYRMIEASCMSQACSLWRKKTQVVQTPLKSMQAISCRHLAVSRYDTCFVTSDSLKIHSAAYWSLLLFSISPRGFFFGILDSIEAFPILQHYFPSRNNFLCSWHSLNSDRLSFFFISRHFCILNMLLRRMRTQMQRQIALHNNCALGLHGS